MKAKSRVRWFYQRAVKPLVAVCTCYVCLIGSIHLLSELLTDYPSLRDDQWFGAVWVVVTLFWVVYLGVWGLGGGSGAAKEGK